MQLQSVDALASVECAEALERTVSDASVPTHECTIVEHAFREQIRSAELGPLRLSEISAGAGVVHGSAGLISRNGPECYKVGVQLHGYSVLVQDGREAALAPGDIAVYDTTRPHRLSFDDTFRMLVVMFPRKLLRLPCNKMADLTAMRFSGRSGLGSLVSPFLVNSFDRVADLDDVSAIRLADNMLDLLQTMFAQRLVPVSHVSEDSSRRALLLQTFQFIEAHLGDPELGPLTIAAALHISTRYVHKLFEAEGTTVNAWIRSRRMERCRRDLCEPTLLSQPVSAVGARWGLSDPSRFSRLFRQTFAMSPREYRSLHCAGSEVLEPLPSTAPQMSTPDDDRVAELCALRA